MPKPSLPRPTQAETDILRILWERGPSAVRDVHDEVRRHRDTRLTTTLKQMQVMVEKGILRRDESCRPHLYRPQLSQERTLAQLMDNLLDHAFGGSVEALLLHLLEGRKFSHAELKRIRQKVEELERRPRHRR